MAAKKEVFHVKINGGKEQVIKTKTGIYTLAAMAALSMLDYEESSDEIGDIIEIWCPRLIPEYGPYFYAFNGFNIIPMQNPNK